MATTSFLERCTVKQLLDRWPQTATVFLDHRMACVGCPMAPFESPVEAAGEYALDPQAFLAELLVATAGSE